MDTTTELIATHHSFVTEDQIDHLGHMNVRFYGVNAAAATGVVLRDLEVGSGAVAIRDRYTRHYREQLLGARLVVRSGVLAAGAGELVLFHELRNEDTDDVAATFVQRVAPTGGEDAVFPDDLVARAQARRIDLPPYGQSRSIALDSDMVASAPSFAEAARRGLAIRKARAVSPEECDARGSYIEAMAPMLVWGGEPIDREFPEMLTTGPNGEQMGWASMETRIATRRLPALGERIQSFSATVEVGDKVLHNVMWSYAVADGELLVVFEVVNLAFDITARRPMTIPEPIRAREGSRLQPDLAPRLP